MPDAGPDVLGPAPRDPDQQFWDPEVQTMDREALEALQLDRLRTLVGRAIDGPAPLFARKLAEAGITGPDDLTSLDDLNAIPLTVKQELRDSEAEHPPFGDYRFTGPQRCVRLGTSTGTTGTPTIAMWTRRDIWIEYESAARNWWRNGWRPGQIVTHAHPAYLYGGGMMLSGTLEYFGMLNLWVEPPDTDEAGEKGIAMWQRVKPDLSMVAFSMGRFQEIAAKQGIDLGEVLPQFQLKGFGEKGLPLMTCGLECYAYSSGPCGVEPGGHVHEDWAIIQAIDPATGRDVPDGEWGNLVVTTLDRDNGLLRYDLEEAASITRAPCSCGETTVRGFWGGRFKDLLSAQGKHFQVNEVEQALRTVGDDLTQPTLEWVVVKPTDVEAPLVVRVESASRPGEAELAQRAAAALEEKLGVQATVEVLGRETLARSGYKAVRLVDE